jgi:hypothetical protein
MSFSDCTKYKVPKAVAEQVWQNLVDGEVFITRAGGASFTFATGQKATLKADAESLDSHPEIIEKLLGLYASHPCVAEADALSFVPNGVADFTDKLGKLTGKRVIRMFRPPGAPRADMRFMSREDQSLAREVSTVCTVEDISRTGFSAHVTAQVLRAANPGLEIHTLSMLQRDEVEARYQRGDEAVVYHTFVRQDLPLEIDDFRRQFPGVKVQIVP